MKVGFIVGDVLGCNDGAVVGVKVGFIVGDVLGCNDGESVGDTVGYAVVGLNVVGDTVG